MKLSNDDKNMIKWLGAISLFTLISMPIMTHLQNLERLKRDKIPFTKIEEIQEEREVITQNQTLETKIEPKFKELIEPIIEKPKRTQNTYNLTNRPKYVQETGKCMYNGVEDLWEIPSEEVKKMITSVTSKDLRYYCIRFTSKKNLRELNFEAKDIRGSDFSGVDISGTNFRRAYAQGAIFIDVITNDETDFTDIKTDKYSIMPN